ncbi:MAG: M48 family metalloprotease [Myxococcota bacterium]
MYRSNTLSFGSATVATLFLLAATMTSACSLLSKEDEGESSKKKEEAPAAAAPEYPDSYFECAKALPWPEKLKRSDPIDRLSNYCENGSWDRAKVKAKNCAKAAEARAALECSRLTFSNRARAAKLHGSDTEKSLAEELERAVLGDSRVKLVDSGELVGYVQAVGERVAGARKDPVFSGSFSFRLYRSEDETLGAKAFALPGGNVFVSMGLVEKLDEAEIAFILGHEIARVEWDSYDKEMLSLFIPPERIQQIAGKYLAVCDGPMDDVLADERAVEYSVRAGYDPSAGARVMWGALRSFELLREFSVAKGSPPSSMRASYIFMQADKVATEPVFFRGSVRQNEAWTGQFTDGATAKCKPQPE